MEQSSLHRRGKAASSFASLGFAAFAELTCVVVVQPCRHVHRLFRHTHQPEGHMGTGWRWRRERRRRGARIRHYEHWVGIPRLHEVGCRARLVHVPHHAGCEARRFAATATNGGSGLRGLRGGLRLRLGLGGVGG